MSHRRMARAFAAIRPIVRPGTSTMAGIEAERYLTWNACVMAVADSLYTRPDYDGYLNDSMRKWITFTDTARYLLVEQETV